MGSAASIPAMVNAQLWLRLGAELIAEPWQQADCDGVARAASADLAAKRADLGIDGALSLRTAAGVDLCRDDLWDRVDGLLLAWLRGLDAIEAGADQVTVEFPDTRIEALIAVVAGTSGQQLHVRYEDIDCTVAPRALRQALEGAATRLVQALGTCTPALTELAARNR